MTKMDIDGLGPWDLLLHLKSITGPAWSHWEVHYTWDMLCRAYCSANPGHARIARTGDETWLVIGISYYGFRKPPLEVIEWCGEFPAGFTWENARFHVRYVAGRRDGFHSVLGMVTGVAPSLSMARRIASQKRSSGDCVIVDRLAALVYEAEHENSPVVPYAEENSPDDWGLIAR